MKAYAILVFNSGSSSLKFGLYRVQSSLFDDFSEPELVTETLLGESVEKETFKLNTLLEGEVAFLADGCSQFNVKDATKKTELTEKIPIANHTAAALHIIRYFASFSTPKPSVVVHRIVHGGSNLRQHCLLNDKVIRQLKASIAFAPLHNQIALDIIQLTRKTFPQLPQVSCFDTVFHNGMPEVARVLPIAKELQSLGIQRYGFHGLSCESIVAQLENLPNLLPEKLIIAHLGNGSSVTAVKNGRSIDTSMGLTPSGGVMMGTRSGDIDPGVLIFLMREKNYDVAAIEALINHQSGLLGVSGLSGDMRVLHKSVQSNADAKLAIELFCDSIAKQIAAMACALNGVDALVFTGGIGENDALIRAEICTKLTLLGLNINTEKNQQLTNENNVNSISDATSHCSVLVVTSNENAQIARHAFNLLQ